MPIHTPDDSDFWENTPAARRDSHDRAVEAGWKISMYPLGADSNADDIPLAVLMYIPPGGVLPRHSHACYRVEVMVKGSMETPSGQVIRPGDVNTSNPGEEYGPHVAGPEGSLSVEIFSVATGLVGRTPEGGRTRAVPMD